MKTANTGDLNECLRYDLIETVTVHGSSATNTGGPYLRTRRAMHIARAKAAQTGKLQNVGQNQLLVAKCGPAALFRENDQNLMSRHLGQYYETVLLGNRSV